MKHAGLTLIAALLMLPGMAAAQLGPSDTIVTEVPFQFMVGDRSVPAGRYIVKLVYEESPMMVIENDRAKVRVAFLVNEEEARVGEGISLIFHKYGDHYFLRGIRLNGSTIEHLSESKVEAEFRARGERHL